jgi:hypothetical protein
MPRVQIQLDRLGVHAPLQIGSQITVCLWRRGKGRGRRLRAVKLGDRAQNLATMTERSDTEVFHALICQIADNREIDIVISKLLGFPRLSSQSVTCCIGGFIGDCRSRKLTITRLGDVGRARKVGMSELGDNGR